jgi:hypothetical protein
VRISLGEREIPYARENLFREEKIHLGQFEFLQGREKFFMAEINSL